MDNLTHSLVGLTVAKAGLGRLSPIATTVCVLGANAPDSDVVVGLFADRWTLLHHHRGITHAIVGTLCLGVILPLIVYGFDQLLSRWRGRPPTIRPLGLLIASLVATATHPSLDWLNNYGVRPLLPWDSTWYYGDLLYIIDPFMWLMLGGAAVLLTGRTRFLRICWLVVGLFLTWLVVFGPGRRSDVSNPTVLAVIWLGALAVVIILFAIKAGKRWGGKIAIASLLLVGVYWCGLTFARSKAVTLATSEASVIANQNQESVSRLAVMPTLANPLRWDCLFLTNGGTYRFRVGLIEAARISRIVHYPTPTGELAAAIQQVSDDRRTKIFLHFARFPVAQLKDPACTTDTLVQFADLRYTEPGRSRATFTIDLPVDCRTFASNR